MSKEDIFNLAIKAVIKNNRNEILVLEKNSGDRVHLNPPHWDLPGGRLKKGDDIEITLKKEVAEEIGVNDIQIIKYLDADMSNFRVQAGDVTVGLIIFMYLCEIKDSDKIELTDDEHSQFKWVSPDQAAELLNLKFGKKLTKVIKNL